MTRDEAYSFWCIGRSLERADAQVRALSVLVPALAAPGQRGFEDVRLRGLLECLGADAMYRRRFHASAELSAILGFVLAEPSFPGSVRYAATVIERELDRLPRPAKARSALLAFVPHADALAGCSGDDFAALADPLVAGMLAFHARFSEAYFPSEPQATAATVQAVAEPARDAPDDPFAHLGREHATVEQVLCVVDELSAQAECGAAVAHEELLSVVNFFLDAGIAAHHEKEEALLMPMLVRCGFDWHDGALAAVRRDHRQEHYFLRVLLHLARQTEPWSPDERRHFASVAREFTQFLRDHMRREQSELFAPAAERLTAEDKATLLAEFVAFDAQLGTGVDATRRTFGRSVRAAAGPTYTPIRQRQPLPTAQP
jgi:hemerythrin-like domain-containing protein